MAIAPPFDTTDPADNGWLPGALGEENGFGAPDDTALISNSGAAIPEDIDVDATLLDTPEADPLLARVESALSGFLEQDKNNAVAMHQPRKYEVAKYKQQLDGQGLADDPTDALVQLGCYLPMAAHKVDVLVANLMREISPKSSDGIAFNINAQVNGLESYAKKATAALQRKLISATPAATDTVYQLVEMLLKDFLACGCDLAMVGHEGIADDANRDGIRQGPVPQYVDFMNWWPNAYDVNRTAQCDHFLYAPIDIYQFKAAHYENEAEALKRCAFSSNTRRDTDSFDQYQYQNNYLWWQYTTENLARRYIYIGKFPGEDLRQRANLGDITDDEMIYALAFKYGAEDPEAYFTAAQETYWWHMEFCDGVLLRVQPYPLEVPAGQCPLIMTPCFKRNGLLMPYGVFDRGASWADRLGNFYYRAKIHITKAAMNPPWYYREGMIKPSYMQQQGTEQPSLVQGVGIPIVSNDAVKPIETITYNAGAIPIAEEQRATHENDLADLMGSTDALQGTAESKTATQDQNNLQQSNAFADYYAIRFGQGLITLLKNMYVVLIQSFELGGTGYTEYVPADLDDIGMQLVRIQRQDLLALEFLEFELTGPSAPGNRMNQALVVDRLTSKYMPYLNPLKAAEAEFELAGVGALLTPALLTPDMLMAIQGMQNANALLGPEGAAATGDPMLQAQMSALMGGGMGQRPPGGGGGKPGAKALPAPQGSGTPVGGNGGTGGFAGRG